MTIPKDNSQLEKARRLRREMTPHERKLWYLFLRKYPAKIYKQRPAVTALPKGEPRAVEYRDIKTERIGIDTLR